MKVKFTGFIKWPDVADWFTVGKVYETIPAPFRDDDRIWAVSDDGEEDPMYPGEYEVVEE